MPDGEDSALTAAWISRVITRLKANGLTAELAEIERLQQTSNLPVLSWWRSWAGNLGAGAGIGSYAAMAGTNPQGRAWRAVRATIKTLQAEDRTAGAGSRVAATRASRSGDCAGASCGVTRSSASAGVRAGAFE